MEPGSEPTQRPESAAVIRESLRNGKSRRRGRCRGSCRPSAFAPPKSLTGEIRGKKGEGRWVGRQGTGFCRIVLMSTWPASYAGRGRNYPKRSPIPGLTNFGSAALTHVPRSHAIVCNRGSAMTLNSLQFTTRSDRPRRGCVAERNEHEMHCARFEAGSSTGLRRADKHLSLGGRIDLPSGSISRIAFRLKPRMSRMSSSRVLPKCTCPIVARGLVLSRRAFRFSCSPDAFG